MMKKESLIEKIDQFVSLAGGKRIMFHGSSLSNLPSIMSQGLIPDPKKRYWNPEDHKGSFSGRSLQSYGGIYLADNFQSARAAVQDIKKAIIVVSVSEGSLIADEDDLDHLLIDEIINQGFERIDFESVPRLFIGVKKEDPLYLKIYQSLKNSYININLIRIEEKIKYINSLHNQYRTLHPKLLERIKQVLDEGFSKVLARQVSYTDYHVRHSENFNTIAQEMGYSGSIPNQAQAELEFRQYADTLTRLLKTAFGAKTARILTPIRFSGANKIVAVFVYDGSSERKDKLIYPKTWDQVPSEVKNLLPPSVVYPEIVPQKMSLKDMALKFKQKELTSEQKQHHQEMS